MTILKHELKANFKSLLIWSASMAFMIYAGILKYSAFAKTGDAVNEIFAGMPPMMLKVFGVSLIDDLTSLSGFYSIFFLYFMLLAAVHSAMLGTLIIAKEERDKTADFLFVKPITRTYVITWKIIAALINILALNAVTFVVSVLATAPYVTGDPINADIAFVCMGLFFFQLLFLGIGLLLAGLFNRSKVATGIGTAVILSTFSLKVLIDLNKDVDFLTALTPFKYFSARDMMFDHQLEVGYVALALVLATLCTIGTYYFFNRRDLSS